MTTVLVVDDEPMVRDVVSRYHERDGHRVVTAGDGESAREIIERDAPSLVLLDVMLPGKTDGLALCRWIRSSSELPVILLTARVDEADRIVGLELGADDYVTKPFSPRELVTAGDGESAREIIERDAPSLVLLDVMLPGKTDGLALCRWIRSSSELPVILLTARVDEADRIVGLELGADDYVTKPFSPRELA